MPATQTLGRPVYCFSSEQMSTDFPPVSSAMNEPDGLLAAGGDLSRGSLLAAYQRGIFPWYNAGQPILWWSPNPRAVLYPQQLHISRSLRRTLRHGDFDIRIDSDFPQVMAACAEPRRHSEGTWILPEMIQAYTELHSYGDAHAFECWQGTRLVGGLYGVGIGAVFFAESMFSRVDNASKVCMVVLCDRLRHWGYQLIDCQIINPHLQRMGASTIPRVDFIRLLEQLCSVPVSLQAWSCIDNQDPASEVERIAAGTPR